MEFVQLREKFARAHVRIYVCVNGYRGFLAETRRIAILRGIRTARGMDALERYLGSSYHHLNLISTISTHFVTAQSAGTILYFGDIAQRSV